MILNNPKCACDHMGCCNSELEAECYRLNELLRIASDHLQKMQATNGSLTDEIHRLKAELERMANDFVKNELDRVTWKSKADKLAEELERINKEHDHDHKWNKELLEICDLRKSLIKGLLPFVDRKAINMRTGNSLFEEAKAALAEFEERT